MFFPFRRSRTAASPEMTREPSTPIPNQGGVAVLLSGRGSNFAAMVRASGPAAPILAVRLVISDRADAAGLEKAARSRHSRPLFSPARNSRQGRLRKDDLRAAGRRGHRPGLPGRLHAPGRPRAARPLRRPHPEHPPGPAALLSRPGRPAPGAALRRARSAAAPSISSTPAPTPGRSSPSRRWRSRPATAKRPSAAGSCARSTACTPRGHPAFFLRALANQGPNRYHRE